MNIFHRIYCSDYLTLSVITLLATIFVSAINSVLKNKKWYRYICFAGILAFVGVILYATLMNRSSNEREYVPHLIPFSSLKIAFQGNEEGFRVCFMNSLLFYPIGCLFYAYNNKRFKPIYFVLVGFAITLVVEILQYMLQLGVAEVDDLIFNTLGVALGYSICLIFDSIFDLLKKVLE